MDQVRRLNACLDLFFEQGEPAIRAAFGEWMCNQVVRVSSAIAERRFPDAVKIVGKLEPDLQRVMRSRFSKAMLWQIQREWTGHGINRTFRFWTSEQKVGYLKFTVEVCNALRDRYDASLGYGTVLSIVRDNDLIPHDDDLDIIVCVPKESVVTYKQTLEEIQGYLSDKGFALRGDYLAHRHVGNGKFLLDVFLGLQEGEHVSWHPGPRGKILRSDVFPVRNAELYGIECPIPADPERYLEHVYGSDWRTPSPGWTHDFNPAKYSDWFWPKT